MPSRRRSEPRNQWVRSSKQTHIGIRRRREIQRMEVDSPPPPSAATRTTIRLRSGVVRSATALERESQCHRPEARRPRRSAIDTSDSVTRSSFSSDRQMRSSPERMASSAAVSSRPQIRPNTPSVRLIMRWRTFGSRKSDERRNGRMDSKLSRSCSNAASFSHAGSSVAESDPRAAGPSSGPDWLPRYPDRPVESLGHWRESESH